MVPRETARRPETEVSAAIRWASVTTGLTFCSTIVAISGGETGIPVPAFCCASFAGWFALLDIGWAFLYYTMYGSCLALCFHDCLFGLWLCGNSRRDAYLQRTGIDCHRCGSKTARQSIDLNLYRVISPDIQRPDPAMDKLRL